ncbi:hypothetical protein C1Y08_14530 [Pseudomonas sp. FW306-02-F02-AA]|nr:hypothetical protein C1Y08_14530 [Pseudomonas sp. FW306-02-F02-AA]PMZ40318.1 hypothetical protein C1Y00_11825 [Pseudomonas sp. FW306-2-11AB]PNA17317.1 hypothetical protein C1X93_09195 [Pseudomonas sp. GW456-11-11-14-LB1]PNB32123.1 hypothetical protein C1Y02_08720 [Pseudomonas sp. FW306-02-F04-AA]
MPILFQGLSDKSKNLTLEAVSVVGGLAPAGLRSSPIFRPASRPSGSKLPRHRGLRCFQGIGVHDDLPGGRGNAQVWKIQ